MAVFHFHRGPHPDTHDFFAIIIEYIIEHTGHPTTNQGNAPGGIAVFVRPVVRVPGNECVVVNGGANLSVDFPAVTGSMEDGPFNVD